MTGSGKGPESCSKLWRDPASMSSCQHEKERKSGEETKRKEEKEKIIKIKKKKNYQANVNVSLGKKSPIEIDNMWWLCVIERLELQQDPLPDLRVHIQLDNLECHELLWNLVPDLLHNSTTASANILQNLKVIQLNVVFTLAIIKQKKRN